MTEVVLGNNQYGKAQNHVVRINRDNDRHIIRDLVVTSQLRGDLTEVHTKGDNAHCVPTDTQKNTVFAFAQQYDIKSPEDLILKLSDHFTSEFDWISGGRWAADEYRWDRINDNDHCFVQNKQEVRTSVLVTDGDKKTVISGFKDLTILKSTESGFEGYPKDKYTTLKETTDRIMSTDVRPAGVTTPPMSTSTPCTTASRTSSSPSSPTTTPVRCRKPCTSWARP